MKPSGPGLLFAGRFLITVSISVLVMGLLRFSISSWSSFGQSRFDAQYWMLGAGALGQPRGMVQGGRREEGSGWGTHVYLSWIHFDIWQNQYNIVKLKNKIKLKQNKTKKNKTYLASWTPTPPLPLCQTHLFLDPLFSVSTVDLPQKQLWIISGRVLII